MTPEKPQTPDNLFAALENFQLFDIAETAAQAESQAWGEEPGMNLFLEDTINLLLRELEAMPEVCAARTGERSRLWLMAGKMSNAAAQREQLAQVARYADVFVFGLPDADFPPLPGGRAVALRPGTVISHERSVIVDGSLFGAALFAHEAGKLDEESEMSRYYEGFLTANTTAIETAVTRLNDLLGLAPLPRHLDHNLMMSWHSRLNTRVLEHLEGQKLALRARTQELTHLADERRRLEKMVSSYMDRRTWDDLQEAIERGDTVVEDRREELTICFCDLVGFTRISERLHYSEVAAILNDHYARLYDIVRAHGGWVDKFIGDAMLAVFESPVEGMTAAQKMVINSRSVKVGSRWDLPIQVRVGLNTGVVAVANLGVPERRERTVLGDAVNLAQRLQSIAHPHTVLISEQTFVRLPFSLVKNLEPFETQVKGKRDALTAYLWTVHSDRRLEPDEKIALRGSLLNASRRAPLSERLKGARNAPPRAEASDGEETG